MLLCFKLSMPGKGSWDGKWTAEGDFYAIVENLGRSKKAESKGQAIIDDQPYIYSWDDGWRARVKVYQVTAKDAAKIRKHSKGFCGYGWMVDSIIRDGSIHT